jgi:hypothetical protein
VTGITRRAKKQGLESPGAQRSSDQNHQESREAVTGITRSRGAVNGVTKKSRGTVTGITRRADEQ